MTERLTSPDHVATARAFDAAATDYDAIYGLEGNAMMTWLRQQSLTLLQETFPPGSRLLEIGCGTGDEAIHLAHNGYMVLATDISPSMAAQTRAKAQATGLADRVTALALPAGRLGALHPSRPFDGAYSSFGSLNCEPDLALLRSALARLLRPEAAFVCSVMAPWCPFEIGWHLLRGRPRAAFRRLRRGWQPVPVVPGAGSQVTVAVRYLSADDVKQAFAPAFAVRRVMSLPLLLPPPYLDGLYRRYQGLFVQIEKLEHHLRQRWPWRGMGDHIGLVLQKVGEEEMPDT